MPVERPMLSREEVAARRRAAEERFSPWKKQTLGDWFDERVAEFGERELIFTLQRSYSYRETQELVNNLARGLLKLGIKRREHVAYILANYPEALFLRFALAKIGAVAVGIHIRSGVEEIRYFLKHAEVACLVTMDRFARIDYIDRLKELCPELSQVKGGEALRSAEFPSLRYVVTVSQEGEKHPGTVDFYSLVAEGREVPGRKLEQAQAASRHPDEVCELLYSSSSLGRPIASPLWHDGFLRAGYGHIYSRPSQDGRRIFAPVPLSHVFGYAEALIAGMDVGGALVLEPSFALPEAYELIEKGRAYDMMCVPMMMLGLLYHPDREKYDLSSLKGVVVAGAPAPVPLWEKTVAELGLIELATGYGQTETHGGTCYSAPDASIDTLAHRIGRVKLGGAASLPEFHGSFCQYKVIDPASGRDVPQGEEGELACRGATIIRGYYNSPEADARMFDKEGWMRTGDRGIIHDDGYIELTGRVKEIYILAGENVAPREVEDYISRYPKVKQVHIVGVPDARLGEIGLAYVELKRGESCTEREIIDFCKKGIARYKVPRYVKFVADHDFSVNTAGEVEKSKLRERGIKELAREGIAAEYESMRKVT